jgi:hypothetical protein
VTGRRAVVAAVLGLVAGCGGGSGPLAPAGGFEPPAGAVLTGRGDLPDKVGQFPSYRLRDVREGAPLRYRVRLHSGGEEPVTITGVDGDEDIDGQFVSAGVAGPVRIAPGTTSTVEVVGRLGRCADRAAGQLTSKSAQRFRYRSGDDEHTQDVDLDAILEIVSPADAGCPSRGR